MQLVSPVSPTGEPLEGPQSPVSATLSPENKAKLMAILNHNIYPLLPTIHEKIEHPPCTDTLSVIGRGKASTVYRIPESFDGVLKFGNPRDLLREKIAIEKLYKGFKIYRHHIHDKRFSRRVAERDQRIAAPKPPKVRAYLEAGDGQLRQFRERMPTSSPQNDETNGHCALIIPSITPFTVGVRRQIVGKYFKAHVKEAVLADPENEHCLIRPLLGLNNPNGDCTPVLHPLHGEETSLRDFPAYFGQLESYLSPFWLQILVKQIAISYAVMHWAAGIDGRGVELLLGMNRHGKVTLFIIDLEDTGDFIKLNQDEVKERLVPAVHGSNAYIPRPSISPEMWELFEDTYCEISYDLMKACPMKYREENIGVFYLPELFTTLLKEAFERDEIFKSIDDAYIQFGSDTDDEIEEEDSDDDVDDDDEDSDDDSEEVAMVEEKAPIYASWADEMDNVDPILPNYSLSAQTTFANPSKVKKTVRFAEWKNEVFEVPADEEARKIDLRYLYPKYREDDSEDETDDENVNDEEDNFNSYYGDDEEVDWRNIAQSYNKDAKRQRRNSL